MPLLQPLCNCGRNTGSNYEITRCVEVEPYLKVALHPFKHTNFVCVIYVLSQNHLEVKAYCIDTNARGIFTQIYEYEIKIKSSYVAVR